MVYENPKRVEARIKKLSREIAEIEDFFYGSEKDGDRLLYMGMLESKRDDVVRSAVLQLHTSIEDLMTEMLFGAILGAPHRRAGRKRRHTKRGQALDQLVQSLGFDAKLNFATVVGVINFTTRNRLKELNRVRNKCSHNWQLNIPAARQTNKKGPRLRLLTYNGRDLHRPDVLKDFCREFGLIYVRLFGRAMR